MAQRTGIEWTDSTFNPWIGCARVSPGCDHCYAARSTPARTLGIVWGPGESRRRTSPANWRQPLLWEKQHAEFFAQHGRRQRVFCASLADVFDNQVPDMWRVDLFNLITQTPHLEWLLLTKRVGNVKRMMVDVARQLFWLEFLGTGALPANVWLGATVVDQAEADRDVPVLMQLPAGRRFLSIEPMLGRVDLCEQLGMWWNQTMGCFESTSARFNHNGYGGSIGIDWVIAGGESGPDARAMHPDWVRSLRDQCRGAAVPFLFNQWGEWTEFDADGLPGVRVAREGEPEFEDQADQCEAFISLDGTMVRSIQEMGRGGVRYRGLIRPGKKAAGRLLDGVEELAWPSP